MLKKTRSAVIAVIQVSSPWVVNRSEVSFALAENGGDGYEDTGRL